MQECSPGLQPFSSCQHFLLQRAVDITPPSVPFSLLPFSLSVFIIYYSARPHAIRLLIQPVKTKLISIVGFIARQPPSSAGSRLLATSLLEIYLVTPLYTYIFFSGEGT